MLAPLLPCHPPITIKYPDLVSNDARNNIWLSNHISYIWTRLKSKPERKHASSRGETNKQSWDGFSLYGREAGRGLNMQLPLWGTPRSVWSPNQVIDMEWKSESHSHPDWLDPDVLLVKKKYRRCFNSWYTRVLESWTLNCKFRRQAGIFSRCWLSSVLILITALLASDFLRGAAVFVRMETIDYFWWAEMGGCFMMMMIGGWLMIMGMILSLPWRLLRSICLEISKHFPPSDYFKGLYFTTGWLSMFITDFFSELRKQTNLCLGCETQLVSQKAIKAGTLNINTAYNSMPSGIRKRAITVCLYYCCTCTIAVLLHSATNCWAPRRRFENS